MTSNNTGYPASQIKGNTDINSESALQKLIEGNKRYISGKLLHPNQTAERRTEVANTPYPFAVILTCSDSRVPPEIIFDCGLGDLFIIRVAGNVLNSEITGSIEYAVEYFGAKLVVVMGHKRCGAILAAIQGGKFPGNIKSLVDAVRPAIEKAKSKSGDLAENAVNENVSIMVEKLKSPESILADYINQGKIKIIGACYDMDNGSVAFNE